MTAFFLFRGVVIHEYISIKNEKTKFIATSRLYTKQLTVEFNYVGNITFTLQ